MSESQTLPQPAVEMLLASLTRYRDRAREARRTYARRWPEDTPYNGAEEEGEAMALIQTHDDWEAAASDVEAVLRAAGVSVPRVAEKSIYCVVVEGRLAAARPPSVTLAYSVRASSGDRARELAISRAKTLSPTYTATIARKLEDDESEVDIDEDDPLSYTEPGEAEGGREGSE